MRDLDVVENDDTDRIGTTMDLLLGEMLCNVRQLLRELA